MEKTSCSAVDCSVTALAILLVLYGATYLLSTKVFCGRLEDTPYRIRLFRSAGHQRIFAPLICAEQWLRPAAPEFSGQVRSGASLPSFEP